MDNDMIVSLSFSSYSTNGLASIAVKITKEFNDAAADGRSFDSLDDDFEFSLVLDDHGQIHHDDFLESKIKEMDEFSVKLPLKTLFGYNSPSSEASDELEPPAIAETTSYCCLWRPKLVESNKWKKNSNSSPNGERRRHKSRGLWNKLFDLLCRSNSGGEGPFVFLNSDHDDRRMKAAPSKFLGSPMEVFYVRNKAENEGSKRKSFLPYRQQLVGFFSATAKRTGN